MKHWITNIGIGCLLIGCGYLLAQETKPESPSTPSGTALRLMKVPEEDETAYVKIFHDVIAEEDKLPEAEKAAHREKMRSAARALDME